MNIVGASVTVEDNERRKTRRKGKGKKGRERRVEREKGDGEVKKGVEGEDRAEQEEPSDEE